jgi:hypothetical protein
MGIRLAMYNPVGALMIPSLPFSTLDLTRKENDYGELVVKGLGGESLSFFQPYSLFEVWSSINGQPEFLDTETAWLLYRISPSIADSGEETFELRAYDMNWLLHKNEISYDNGSAYTDKLDLADDLMVDIISENFGAAAFDPTRNISSWITCAPKKHLGAIVGDSIGHKKILDVFKSFASASSQDGINIYFDLVRTSPAHFEFRTYANMRGVDHSASSAHPVIASTALGNLGSPQVILDYGSEINHVTCESTDDSNNLLTSESIDSARWNASPYARAEDFYNCSNVKDQTTLDKTVQGYLAQGRPHILFNGRLLNAGRTTYGLSYNFGDMITALYKNYSFACHVSQIHRTVDNTNGIQTEANLTAEVYLE